MSQAITPNRFKQLHDYERQAKERGDKSWMFIGVVIDSDAWEKTQEVLLGYNVYGYSLSTCKALIVFIPENQEEEIIGMCETLLGAGCMFESNQCAASFLESSTAEREKISYFDNRGNAS